MTDGLFNEPFLQYLLDYAWSGIQSMGGNPADFTVEQVIAVLSVEIPELREPSSLAVQEFTRRWMQMCAAAPSSNNIMVKDRQIKIDIRPLSFEDVATLLDEALRAGLALAQGSTYVWIGSLTQREALDWQMDLRRQGISSFIEIIPSPRYQGGR